MTSCKTKTGNALTDADIEALAQEAEETDFDVATLKPRRGRPSLGDGPAELVAVRLDPQLHELLERRAKADNASDSEVIREALRMYLAS